MSLTDEDQQILETVKRRYGGDLSRFLKDAAQGLKARLKRRERARKDAFRKEAEEEERLFGKDEEPQPVKKEVPPPPPEPPKEEEKPRRPSLLNLAELQATFQKQLQEGPVKIPTLITSTKKS